MTSASRIADITTYPRQGGSHSSSDDLSALSGYAKSLLSHLPIEVRKRHIVLTNQKGASKRKYVEDDISVVECWTKNSIFYSWNILKEIFRNKEITLVHIQHEFNQFGGPWTLATNLLLFACIRWGTRRKLCLTLHEVLSAKSLNREFLDRVCIKFPVPVTKLAVIFYYSLLAKIAHTLVVQDSEFTHILRKEYGATGPIEIVRIGTEISQPAERKSAGARWQIPESPKTLLFFGTLDWRKGLDLLADAYELLPQGTYQLILAGGRPGRVRHTESYKKWWHALEVRLNKMPGVHILGFVDDFELPLLFGLADLVILPYLVPQRVSAVFNQACSYGIPLIASDVFEAQAPRPMIFSREKIHLEEKIIWALGEGAAELRKSAIEFRQTNTWTTSASTFAAIHEKVIAGAILKK